MLLLRVVVCITECGRHDVEWVVCMGRCKSRERWSMYVVCKRKERKEREGEGTINGQKNIGRKEKKRNRKRRTI